MAVTASFLLSAPLREQQARDRAQHTPSCAGARWAALTVILTNGRPAIFAMCAQLTVQPMCTKNRFVRHPFGHR
jgi:hypothetical protein